MANPEHLAILKQGVEAWNKWREENPDIEPDLINADIWGMKLCGINLHKANLWKAKLHRTDLTGADLSEANLEGANLFLAKLVSANLWGAVLWESNLSYARLSEAILSYATASLTVFGNVDLSTVKGLETISHSYPSTIGIDTLYRSKGNIPESFLRGCGVPDQMIEYARSLTATPIQYYSCFISYSHKDEELAQRIHNDLQASGVRCWFAPHDLKIGDKIRPVIDESIRVHDKLLLILSEHSVQSDWVEHEVEHALDRERIEKKNILFPVRLDESVIDNTAGWAGNVRRQRLIGDFSRWKDHDSYMRAFARLLRDLKAEK
ncbi:hypothetical protein BIU88_07000 [Chlorobaculum limnaeum]|uniref:TIR domain-containing protein n=2 Tax=Chlorobaculum limnaeum TaxID=274537 RepID=A0A1D8D8C8_CHLLM|nr:hypothetical protein BIU88_07000 [Chlorobaculum limnaeum]